MRGSFVWTPARALGAMDAARQAGISIPDDLSIVGFDDNPVSGWPAYNLTTIHQPIAKIVVTAVAQIMDPAAPGSQSHLLLGELIVRGSVRAAKGEERVKIQHTRERSSMKAL